jgi:hypothetical protein
LISGIVNNFWFSRFYDVVAVEYHDQYSEEEQKNQSSKADDQKYQYRQTNVVYLDVFKLKYTLKYTLYLPIVLIFLKKSI